MMNPARAARRVLTSSPALDRPLLSLRLARARSNGSFVRDAEVRPIVIAQLIDLGFPAADAAWNGIGRASDGTIYCVAGTHSLDHGARLFALRPGSSDTELVADLDDALPRARARAIPQGKVHVELALLGEDLLGATHIGYYARHYGVERNRAAARYGPYPGGWFFSVRNRSITPLVQAPAGEGIITMTADPERGVAFALTWPHGLLLELDLRSRSLSNHGPAHGLGEAGSRHDGTWAYICRSLGIDPQTGAVFFSDSSGHVLRYARGGVEIVSLLPRPEMWRKVEWDPTEHVFYGVLWSSGVLFCFDPATLLCEEIGRLCVSGSPAAQVTPLAFVLDGPARQIHALGVGPGVLRSDAVQLPATTVYLTHKLDSGHTEAHGTVKSSDARWITRCESLLISDGTAYCVCWAEVPRTDRSRRAREVRRYRRQSPQQRFRGYTEEVALIRFRTG